MSFKKKHLIGRFPVVLCGKPAFLVPTDVSIDKLHSPKNVEETQGVLKICNEYKIPVWTFSRGKNLGYYLKFRSPSDS
jgi:FAD/FMN-containing dehydrogenase